MIVLIALPLLLGGVASVLLQVFAGPVPILLFKIDIGTVLFIAGIGLTILGGAVYVAVALVERSAERDLRTSLQEADRSRHRFLRRLDHELKNPLTAIRAGLVNLSEAPSLESKEEAFASSILLHPAF